MIVAGDLTLGTTDSQAAKLNLRKAMDDEKVKGFADIVVAKDVAQGICDLWAPSTSFRSIIDEMLDWWRGPTCGSRNKKIARPASGPSTGATAVLTESWNPNLATQFERPKPINGPTRSWASGPSSLINLRPSALN